MIDGYAKDDVDVFVRCMQCQYKFPQFYSVIMTLIYASNNISSFVFPNLFSVSFD